MGPFMSGTIAGCVSTFFGHPFYQVKIMLQMNQANSLKESLMMPYKSHGIQWYFRGVSAPLAFQGIIVGFQYFTNDVVNHFFP